MSWELLASAFGQPSQYDVIQVVVIISVVVVFLVLVMAGTVMSIRKHMRSDEKSEVPEVSLSDLLNTAPPTAESDILPTVVPEPEEPSILPPPPEDEVEVHRRAAAAESFARSEAFRIFKLLPRGAEMTPVESAFGEEAATRSPKCVPEVWIVAGPGELGALAMIIGRHLDTLGVPAAVQQVGATDRLRLEAKREYQTVTAAHLQLFPSPRHRPPSGVKHVIVGVERELLAESRAFAFDELMKCVNESGIPVSDLGKPVTRFTPPPPATDDVVVPVPEGVGTQEDARVLDFLAASQYHMAPWSLMENAGFWAARETWLYVQALKKERGLDQLAVSILCGRGNNGGDGFVIARLLHQWGLTPIVFLVGMREMTTEDNRRNLELLEAEGVKITPLLDPAQLPRFTETLSQSHVAVDALLGTGLDGKVRGPAVVLIEALRLLHKKGLKVIAVDCPSGLDCNTGEPLGRSVEADFTITFAICKAGLLTEKGAPRCGKVVTVPIGLPRDAYRRKGIWPIGTRDTSAETLAQAAAEETSEQNAAEGDEALDAEKEDAAAGTETTEAQGEEKPS
jgi:NAD(P)H-hydrate epimerase